MKGTNSWSSQLSVRRSSSTSFGSTTGVSSSLELSVSVSTSSSSDCANSAFSSLRSSTAWSASSLRSTISSSACSGSATVVFAASSSTVFSSVSSSTGSFFSSFIIFSSLFSIRASCPFSSCWSFLPAFSCTVTTQLSGIRISSCFVSNHVLAVPRRRVKPGAATRLVISLISNPRIAFSSILNVPKFVENTNFPPIASSAFSTFIHRK